MNRSDICKRIEQGTFDLVILSDRFMDVHEQSPAIVQSIRKSVPKAKVVMIFGGDHPVVRGTFERYAGFVGWFFAREIS